jgi:hypothetical protein
LPKELSLWRNGSIILVILIILLKIIFILIFCFAFASVGLRRAAAQLGPPAPPFVSSPGVVSASTTVASTPGITTVVRILTGLGHFDDALAEKLRPALAKAFPTSIPDPVKGAAAATSVVPAYSDPQKQVAEAAHQ